MQHIDAKVGTNRERYTPVHQSALTRRRLAAFGENVLLPPPVGAVRTADVQRRNIACARMS